MYTKRSTTEVNTSIRVVYSEVSAPFRPRTIARVNVLPYHIAAPSSFYHSFGTTANVVLCPQFFRCPPPPSPTNLRKPDEGQGAEGQREVLEEPYMKVYALFLFHLYMSIPQKRLAPCISDTSQTVIPLTPIGHTFCCCVHNYTCVMGCYYYH